MGLFEKKRSVAALGDEALEAIKDELDSVLSVAKSYDELMLKNGEAIISLEGRIRGDLLAFTLYLSGVTKGVRPQEIATTNKLFDIDLSHVDFEIFRKDVSCHNFERAVPPAILLIMELGAMLEREAHRDTDATPLMEEGERANGAPSLSIAFANDLINVYALIGSAFITADSKITERESGDLVRYLLLMNGAVNGPSAPLPPGPATRSLQAHLRLFGRMPKQR